MCGLILIVKTNTSNVNINLTQGIINAFLAACLYASVIILNKFIKNVDDYKRHLYRFLWHLWCFCLGLYTEIKLYLIL